MVIRLRKQRKNASRNTATKTPGRKRTQQKLGFSVGVFLIVLAFVLMGVRTGLNNLTPDETFDDTTSEQQTQENGQTATGSGADLGTAKQPTSTPPSRQSTAANLPETAVKVPVRRHNPRAGASSAPNKIIIFGHLRCRPCRKTLGVALDHVKKNPTTTRLVSKFALANKNSDAGMEAGLFARIAQQEQVFWDVLEHLGQTNTGSAASSALKDKQLINALTSAGIPLAEIRKKLRENTATYMRGIDQDLADFSALQRENIPVVIIDGKIMAQKPGTPPQKQLQARLNAR